MQNMPIKTPHVIKYAYKDLRTVASAKGASHHKWNAECSACSITIQECIGTTSGFVRHLRNKHPELYEAYSIDRSQSLIKSESCDSTVLVSQGSASLVEQAKHVRNTIKNLFVKCPVPMSLADNHNFLQFLQTLNSSFALPSSKEICQSYIPSLHECVLLPCQIKFFAAKYVALTINYWTGQDGIFFAVTGHCVDDFKSFESLLDFYVLNEDKLCEDAAFKLRKLLENLCLADKVMYYIINKSDESFEALNFLNSFIQNHKEELKASVTSEHFEDLMEPYANSENSMKSFIDTFDNEMMWKSSCIDDKFNFLQTELSCNCKPIECFQTALLLVLGDGVSKLDSAFPVLNKCCKLMDVFSKHEVFFNQFGNLESSPKDGSGWIRLYDQLVFIEKLDAVALKGMLENFDYSHLMLSHFEQENLQEFVNILSPFIEVVQLLETSLYPTLGAVVPSIVSLHKILSAFQQNIHYHKIFVCTLFKSLKERFSGLFERISMNDQSNLEYHPFGSFQYIMAAVLDPRYKFIWLDVDHPGNLQVKHDLKASIFDSLFQTAEDIDLVNEDIKSDAFHQPEHKKPRLSSVFASYKNETYIGQKAITTRSVIESYIHFLNERTHTWETVQQFEFYNIIKPLLELAFCAPARSSRVEGVARNGGVFGQENLRSLDQTALSRLMVVKCNELMLS